MVIVGCNDDGGARPTEARRLSTAPGFDGKALTLGVITTEKGIAAPVASSILAGNRLYWDALNTQGGVGDRYPVELRVVDSENFESVGALKFDEISDDVVLVNQIYGTRNTRAVVPRLDTDGILASPSTFDAEWVREPGLLPVGAPSDIQAANAIAYHAEQDAGGQGRLCTLWEDDTYGRWGLDGAEHAADELGIELVATPTFGPIAVDFAQQLDELEAANCNTVVFSGNFFQTPAALEQAQARGFMPQWIVLARGWSSSLGTQPVISDYLADHVWLAAEGPAWGDESVDGMQQLLAAAERTGTDPQPDLWFAFGYAQSWAVHQVLEEAVSKGDISRKGIARAARSVGTVQMGGLLGDYDYGTGEAEREPPRASTIFAIDPSSAGELAVLRADLTSEPAETFEFAERR